MQTVYRVSINNDCHPLSTIPENQETNSTAPKPIGNLFGLSIEGVPPDLLTRRNIISRFSHWAQLIRNPMRTFVAVRDLLSHKPTDAVSVLYPNAIVETRNSLLEKYNEIINWKAELESTPESNPTLRHYESCKEAFSKAEQSFLKAFKILNNNSSSWAEYASSNHEAMDDYRNLNVQVDYLRNEISNQNHANLSHTRRGQNSHRGNLPGAFPVSLGESNSAGIRQHHDAHRPIKVPHAVIIPVAVDITEQLEPINCNFDKLPKVETMLVPQNDIINIPPGEVANLSTHEEIAALNWLKEMGLK